MDLEKNYILTYYQTLYCSCRYIVHLLNKLFFFFSNFILLLLLKCCLCALTVICKNIFLIAWLVASYNLHRHSLAKKKQINLFLTLSSKFFCKGHFLRLIDTIFTPIKNILVNLNISLQSLQKWAIMPRLYVYGLCALSLGVGYYTAYHHIYIPRYQM